MNDFSRDTIRKLARKGIRLIGLTAIPVNGSFLNAERGYCLDDNGTHRVRTFREVLELAS